MKIKSRWLRKWHDETEVDDLKIILEAWHDAQMDVGLIIVSYNKGEDSEKKVPHPAVSTWWVVPSVARLPRASALRTLK